jgi:hypothetical protein
MKEGLDGVTKCPFVLALCGKCGGLNIRKGLSRVCPACSVVYWFLLAMVSFEKIGFDI